MMKRAFGFLLLTFQFFSGSTFASPQNPSSEPVSGYLVAFLGRPDFYKDPWDRDLSQLEFIKILQAKAKISDGFITEITFFTSHRAAESVRTPGGIFELVFIPTTGEIEYPLPVDLITIWGGMTQKHAVVPSTPGKIQTSLDGFLPYFETLNTRSGWVSVLPTDQNVINDVMFIKTGGSPCSTVLSRALP